MINATQCEKSLDDLLRQQSETMAIISPSIMKSKSKRILDVCCKPEEIGHLKKWGLS
jgi:hypothetical protein